MLAGLLRKLKADSRADSPNCHAPVRLRSGQALLESGTDIRTLEDLLDHKDMATTQLHTM